MNPLFRCCAVAFLLFAVLAGISAAIEAKPALQGGPGWCCVDCEVRPLAPATCAKEEGEFFPDRPSAEKSCEAQKGWCCEEGALGESTRPACEKRKGAFFCEKAEARKKCVNPVKGRLPGKDGAAPGVPRREGLSPACGAGVLDRAGGSAPD